MGEIKNTLTATFAQGTRFTLAFVVTVAACTLTNTLAATNTLEEGAGVTKQLAFGARPAISLRFKEVTRKADELLRMVLLQFGSKLDTLLLVRLEGKLADNGLMSPIRRL